MSEDHIKLWSEKNWISKKNSTNNGMKYILYKIIISLSLSFNHYYLYNHLKSLEYFY